MERIIIGWGSLIGFAAGLASSLLIQHDNWIFEGLLRLITILVLAEAGTMIHTIIAGEGD